MIQSTENTNPLLEIRNLEVHFQSDGRQIDAVNDITLSINRGETIGVVGESGSGKSVTALSILNLIPSPPGIIKNGIISFQSDHYGEVNLLELNDKEMRKIRGHEISMIFQEPMTSLNPVFTCGNQMVESLILHKNLSRREAREKAVELFREVKLPRPEIIYDSYPHHLSGGQKQRVMIAMALACKPKLIIADEPTTALDVTVQANILRLLKNLREQMNSSIMFITHDLGVIAEIADRVLVMSQGKIVEQGPLWDVFSDPKHPYTKGLLACRPRLDLKLKVLPTVADFISSEVEGGQGKKYNSVGEAILLNVERKEELIERRLSVIKGGSILEVKDLKKYYPVQKGLYGRIQGYVKAVDGISFEVYPGETIGLVGESGCGKTTLGRMLIGLIASTSGNIKFDGQDISSLSRGELKQFRKTMQIIFQDPYSTLNPRQTIGKAILEPMKIHGMYGSSLLRKNKVFELLNKVGLHKSFYNRYPHEFSGGQRQRISIARTLSLNPKFIILDESVSALDVSVQAQVLNLLNQLKKDFGFTYIFISHDLSVVKFMSDRIFVMREGKFIEMGFPEDMYLRPKEPYTRDLIDSIPKGDLEDIRKNVLRKKILNTARQIKEEIKAKNE